MVHQDNEETIGSLISGKLPGSSEAMDAKRVTSTLRDFLMKLDQARDWVCTITGDTMDIAKFKEELPKGEILAKVVKAFDPAFVDRIHVSTTREYRHTDNIILFLNWCRKIKLRKHFIFETVDIYESKNIPKVIYCIHGLAMFLNKRGIGKGIIVKDDLVFTYAEKSLFSDDINNIITMQKYDDIHTKLDSEDEGENDIVKMSTKQPRNFQVDIPKIKTFMRCFSWRRAFKSLISGENVSVSILRKFIDFDFSAEKAQQIITEQQMDIVDMFKRNNAKEIEKDSLLHTIKLLHENVNLLRSIPTSDYPLSNNHKIIKKILFHLIHDYRLCYDIISSGYELPLRTLFPDNLIGDYHFSRFIAANMNKDHSKLMSLARSHFISSKVFKTLVNAYQTTADFNINPIHIHNYLMRKEALNSNHKSLLDDAISEEAVREEILKRSQLIVEFINNNLNFLCNVELPYYVKVFVNDNQFFEQFIEPAITASENFVVADILSHIFSNSSFSVNQERIYKDNNDFVKTNSIDFSDYSPLKDFIEDSKDVFRRIMVESHSISNDVNEYFIQYSGIGDLLQVEISVEEINNIVVVLKQNTHLMIREMHNLVDSLEIFSSASTGGHKVELYSQFGTSKSDHPVTVDGKVFAMTESESSSKYKEINIENKAYKSTLPSCSTEKFTLRLDNQYSSELDEDDSVAVKALFRDLKYRLMLLIATSRGNTLDSVLNTTSDEEIETFLQMGISNTSLASLKETVISDIKLLVNKGVISSSNEYAELLSVIATDILSCKYRLLNKEIDLNMETSDALFHKGAMLDRYLQCLYRYTNDLVSKIFKNKSGRIFNRQVEPYSKYGTYLMPLNSFKSQIYENLDSSDVQFKVRCEEPMIFEMALYLKENRMCNPVTIRFDTLLKMKDNGILYFDLAEICCLSVADIITMINDKYIDY